MGRVAVKAANIATGMRGYGNVALFVCHTMTTQAAFIRILPRDRFETDDLADVTPTLNMG
jgi:ribosomal protein S11